MRSQRQVQPDDDDEGEQTLKSNINFNKSGVKNIHVKNNEI